MDIRAIRTQKALHQAVLELAQTTNIAQLSVTEVAKAAQINRVTFYSHAASPEVLLFGALTKDLNRVRDQLVDPQTATPISPDRPIVSLAQHLVSHLSLYRTNIGADGRGAVADFLTEHFAQSVSLLLDENAAAVSKIAGLNRPLSQVALEATAQFIAHGSIGVIAVWLHASPTPQPDELVLLLDHLLPRWWIDLNPDSSNTGRENT